MRAAAGLLALALFAAACATPLAPEGVSDTAAHHYTLGMKLLEQNELARAQQEFERARALAPDHAPAWEGLGLVALARKDYPAAETAFRTSKSKDRRYVPAYLGMARLHAARAEHDAARREAETAIEMAPREARAHIVLGQVRLAAFDFTRAESAFARALELEPGSALARREWDRSVRIRQAAPGTMVGKRIALADPITRGELAVLLATELEIESRLRRKRPEIFDASFRAPGAAPATRAAGAPRDTAGHWAGNAVDLVLRLGLMESFPDGTFRPDDPVDRAGFAGVLQQVLAVATNDTALKTRHVGQVSPFPDVRGDHFAFNAAIVASTRGLMEGERPSGAFRLTRAVSGAEAVLALRKLGEIL